MFETVGAIVAAFASAAAAHQNVTDTTCELHIWPTANYNVFEVLAGPNTGVLGDLMDKSTHLKYSGEVRKQLGEDLSPEVQKRIMSEFDFAASSITRKYKIVWEPAMNAPVWNIDTLKSMDRLSPNTPKCYAELALVLNEYFRINIGSRIRTFYRYREFDEQGKIHKKSIGNMGTRASEFPAKIDDALPAATASVQAAFRSNFLKIVTEKIKS